MRLLLFATSFAIATQAGASDHDAQAWSSITATTALSARVDATMEAHSRYTDDVSRMGQLLLRPSVTLKLPRGWSVTAGYVYVRTRFAGTLANDEHRAWQQVGYTFARSGAGLLLNGRTRIEERFRPDADGVGWRLRQQVRAQLPLLRRGGLVRAVVWNETFVGLNTTPWDRHPGVDQVRTFLGVSLPVAPGVTVEPGYLNQTIFRIGADRVNHIAAANIFARF